MATLPFAPFALGPIEGVPIEVVGVMNHGSVRRTRYTIRYGCCGNEINICHKELYRKLRFSTTMSCLRCAKSVANAMRAAGEAPRREVKLTIQRERTITMIENFWPRPPMLANLAPSIWGDAR